ncbi:MAG: type VI secretion system contractile sheath small subunit [Desulfobacterales bacterium]|nr:type VI secretion system contractile sheath small subunit [Desulfobacterales bacterium]
MAIQDEIPKSRLTLRYKTEVNGQPEDLSLPMRFMVMGDFSKGSSKDRKVDLEERQTRNMDGTNTDAIMKDMDLNLSFSVDNKIDPDKEEETQVNLPFTSMRSFSPDEVAENVPKIKGLLMLKELLQEVMSNVDNRKSYRKLLSELMSNEEALKSMIGELEGFESFKLPTKQDKE